MELLILPRGRCHEFLSPFSNRAVFDPAHDLFIGLVQHWMKKYPGSLHIYHDNSKPLTRLAPFLRKLMTPVAPRSIGLGERTGEFPLRVRELAFVDSRNHPAVQLSDVLAGAAVDAMRGFRTRAEDPKYGDYYRATASAFEGIWTGGMMASAPDELGFNGEAPGSRSVLDGMVEFMAEVDGGGTA